MTKENYAKYLEFFDPNSQFTPEMSIAYAPNTDVKGIVISKYPHALILHMVKQAKYDPENIQDFTMMYFSALNSDARLANYPDINGFDTKFPNGDSILHLVRRYGLIAMFIVGYKIKW